MARRGAVRQKASDEGSTLRGSLASQAETATPANFPRASAVTLAPKVDAGWCERVCLAPWGTVRNALIPFLTSRCPRGTSRSVISTRLKLHNTRVTVVILAQLNKALAQC
ncbi:hypothetical protein NDU88_007392 [Pleurodeles waltl]|uniref:Uncharacterized protein n=1 Tax=Pleurodeles waltl TaxID=8319 RepID=A0AAV7SS98_PLEWA|nr:hypothetical protein NDU88_007392 [Pleurodeles waltl]